MPGSLRLDRRAFLKGLGGVALALPVLDAMLDSHGEALADGWPVAVVVGGLDQ